MSWNLSFPYGSKIIRTLMKEFNVAGIPTLILLDKEGKVITRDMRDKVMADPNGKDFPYTSSTSTSSSSKNNNVVKKDQPSTVTKIMDFLTATGIFIIATAVVRYFYPQDKYYGVLLGSVIAAWLLSKNAQ